MLKTDKTKHKYLVGFKGDGQWVYCKKFFVKPMTRFIAEREFRKLGISGDEIVLYKLVPVKIKKKK